MEKIGINTEKMNKMRKIKIGYFVGLKFFLNYNYIVLYGLIKL